jgi:hypothetical protein
MNPLKPLELHPEAIRAFNEYSETVVTDVIEVPPNNARPQGFRPEAYVSARISPADLIGEMQEGTVDGTGTETGRMFRHDGRRFGLVGSGYRNLGSLAAKVQATPAFRNFISYGCVLDITFDWVTRKHQGEMTTPFCEYVVAECGKRLKEIEIWIPVYWVYAEEDITLGPCLFRTITTAMIDEWEQHYRSTAKEQGPQVEEFFKKMRKQMQGTLAATFRARAEPERARELARERAEYAVGLLNFFHPAHGTLRTRSYGTLLGQENIQTTTTLVLDNGRLREPSRGLLDRGASPWGLDRAHIQFIRESGLDKLGALWTKDKKSDYDTALLGALQLYSKSSLSMVVTDRLVYIFAALESLLLKNGGEPVQKNIGERMAYIVKNTVAERKRVVEVVDQVYKIRSSFFHHGQQVKVFEFIEEFMVYTWSFFLISIANSDQYPTLGAMFDAIDDVKFG